MVGHISLLLLLWFGLPSLLGVLAFYGFVKMVILLVKVPERYCFDSFALDMEVILGFKNYGLLLPKHFFFLIRPGLACWLTWD